MKRCLFILSTLLLTSTLYIQAQVGIGTTTPNASSALEVQSTTKGVLISRMTGAQRTAIASPAEGLMVYQTNAPIGLWMFINGAWVRMASASDLTGSATGFAANTSGAIIPVVLGGSTVPLADAQNLGSNVTVNGANTVFTVNQTGRYRLWYAVNLTTALLVSSRLVINGLADNTTTVAPTLALNRMSAEAVLNLTAGSTISLELFGLLGVASLLSTGQGAALTIQRVE